MSTKKNGRYYRLLQSDSSNNRWEYLDNRYSDAPRFVKCQPPTRFNDGECRDLKRIKTRNKKYYRKACNAQVGYSE